MKELLECEMHARYEHTAALHLKQARFPEGKTRNHLEWTALQGVSRPKVLELTSGDSLKKGEDVVVVGLVGRGKTSSRYGARRRRYCALLSRAATLVCALVEARDERTLERVQQRLVKVDLLIVDEHGFVPFERAGGELLFNVLAEHHDQRSTVITSNLAFGEWVQVLWDEKLTTALLDRLGHCSDILTTKGLPIGPRGPRKKGVVTRQRSDYTMAQVFIFPLSNCPFFLYHYQWGIYGPQCKSRAWPESWSIGCHPRLRSAPAALHTHLT